MKQMDGEMKQNVLGRCPKGKVQHPRTLPPKYCQCKKNRKKKNRISEVQTEFANRTYETGLFHYYNYTILL